MLVYYKRNTIIECLDDLLTFRNTEGKISPIITGYNWYNQIARCDRIITFSHMHRNEKYKKSMLKDLEKMGYKKDDINERIRDKIACYLWGLDFLISDGIKIKVLESGDYLDLHKYKNSLIEYPEFNNYNKNLVCEALEWELDIPFYNKKELLNLLNLFLRKSSKNLYDNKWNKIIETKEKRRKRNPWQGAWEIPVLLIGKKALEYKKDLPQFTLVNRFSIRENHNEISFIINKNLDLLKTLPYYEKLLQYGFEKEVCLGNILFIKQYIDKIS